MKQTSLVIVGAMLAICLGSDYSSAKAEEFADMIKRVPESANALVMINATAIFDSAIAKQQGWAANREKRFGAGLTSLPPKASKLLLASNIDVDSMHPTWEVAIAEMETRALMSTLAERFQGSAGTVSNVPSVRLPDDSFVLQFSDGTLGTISPGNRQQVTRWVNEVNPSPSPYLQEGVRYADSSAQIIMLLDLKDAFAAHELDLEKLESVQKSKVDKDQLNQLVASVQGVMLGITFRDKTYARLKIDFGQDAALISDMAKPLILDIVGSYGVMIDELPEWTAEVKGKQVFLSGLLTDHGLSRLATLTRLPTTALHVEASQPSDQTATTVAPDQAAKPSVLESTQAYYQSVTHLLENLRAKKSDWKTMGQLAQWFENYGRHVDQLPTLGVDKEMLEYGAYISSQLHSASMGLKGTTIQKRVDEVAATNQTRIYGGALGNISQENWQQSSYGYYGGSAGGNYGRRMETNAAYGIARNLGAAGAMHSELRQQQQAQTAVRTQAKASAATGVQQIVQNIQTATTQVRQSMTDKYQVQF
ncbi:MAG: hypothetical protein H6821_15660 [Planctomycetaceae bacterium]|nr:hypothetical protein [Planctomycetales bacterium]MCB9875607.1 hypothetical protein [Planctomycetaceae bacterium]